MHEQGNVHEKVRRWEASIMGHVRLAWKVSEFLNAAQ